MPVLVCSLFVGDNTYSAVPDNGIGSKQEDFLNRICTAWKLTTVSGHIYCVGCDYVQMDCHNRVSNLISKIQILKIEILFMMCRVILFNRR